MKNPKRGTRCRILQWERTSWYRSRARGQLRAQSGKNGSPASMNFGSKIPLGTAVRKWLCWRTATVCWCGWEKTAKRRTMTGRLCIIVYMMWKQAHGEILNRHWKTMHITAFRNCVSMGILYSSYGSGQARRWEHPAIWMPWVPALICGILSWGTAASPHRSAFPNRTTDWQRPNTPLQRMARRQQLHGWKIRQMICCIRKGPMYCTFAPARRAPGRQSNRLFPQRILFRMSIFR